MKNYSESFVRSILNDTTGEIESHRYTKDTVYKEQKKRGWIPMYKNGYDEVMVNLKSKLEMDMFMDVRDRFTKLSPTVGINQRDLSSKHNTTPATVNRFIKKMCSIEFIMKVDRGVYMMNPFILVPYQSDGLELQKEWTKLMENTNA